MLKACAVANSQLIFSLRLAMDAVGYLGLAFQILPGFL